MLSRFHLIPERYRQTDGETELLYQYRASAHWRAIKMHEKWNLIQITECWKRIYLHTKCSKYIISNTYSVIYISNHFQRCRKSLRTQLGVTPVTIRVLSTMFAVVDLFVCNFESGLCGVLFDPTADFNWTRVSGFDTSNVLYTGPISGQGGSRWYILLDSRARNADHEAR